MNIRRFFSRCYHFGVRKAVKLEASIFKSEKQKRKIGLCMLKRNKRRKLYSIKTIEFIDIDIDDSGAIIY